MIFLNVLTSTTSNEPYTLLLPLALILIVAKVLAIFSAKFKLPQVVGFLLAGLLLGLIKLIPGQTVFTDYTEENINGLAKIGVVLILFNAGLETDLKQIKSVGGPAILITLLGVLVPLGLGALLGYLFMPSNSPITNVFYGVILTATSVSVTVATLKELGKLTSKAGTCVVSAAILDDIIGIILLSLIISLDGKTSSTQYVDNQALNILIMIGLMIAFFAISFLLAFPIKKLFMWLDSKWPHHRRIPIFSLGICFLFAYCAQRFFGVADITGAYIAGLILSTTKPREYLDRKTESEIGVLFAPIFFASVALSLYDLELSSINTMFIIFGLIYVVVALLGKYLGAGLGALMTKFNFKEASVIGVGMMARAEVVIVTAKTGIDAGIIPADQPIMPFILLLIILSSLLTPIFLKLIYKDDKPDNQLPQKEVTSEN